MDLAEYEDGLWKESGSSCLQRHGREVSKHTNFDFGRCLQVFGMRVCTSRSNRAVRMVSAPQELN